MQGSSEQRLQGLDQGEGPIAVAAVWPYASSGNPFWEGLQMALQELNSDSDSTRRRLRLVKYDDQASVTEGMAVAQAIAQDPDFLAVIGHRNSYVAMPAAPIYDRAGLLFIAPSATNPELTRLGHQLTIRTIPSDDAISRQMAEFIAAQGHRRLALLYSDDAYGRGLANAFEDAAAALDITVVDRLSYLGDLQQSRRTITKWEALGYDAIFIAAILPEAAETISLIRQAGANRPIFGGDGLDGHQLLTIAGEAAEGVVFGSVFDPHNPHPTVQKFVADFEQRYGRLPDTWAAQGYDALHLLANALSAADTVSGAAVAEAMRNAPPWQGVTGQYRFDETGELVGKPVLIKQLKAGEFVLLD